MSLILRELELSDEVSFFKAMDEEWEKGFVFAHYFENTAQKNFSNYIILLKNFKSGFELPEGHIASTLLFAFDSEGQIVGRSSIRHELTAFLLNEGGHIGYGVIPRFRRQGFATEILKLSLEYIKNKLPTIERVLVTCDENNIGSKKTILCNNGILEDQLQLRENAPRKNRYWIAIK